jgi:hypothetical protein
MSSVYLRVSYGYGPGPTHYPPRGERFDRAKFSPLTEEQLLRSPGLATIAENLSVVSATVQLPKLLLQAALKQIDGDTPVKCTPGGSQEEPLPHFFSTALELLEDHTARSEPVGVMLETLSTEENPWLDEPVYLSFYRAFGLPAFHALLPLHSVEAAQIDY